MSTLSAELDDDLWASIGDPSRLRILDLLLTQGPSTASGLGRQLPITRQAVAKHLATLERAGLVHNESSGREVLYVVEPDQFARACAQVARVSQAWTMRLNRIKTIAEAIQADRETDTGRMNDYRNEIVVAVGADAALGALTRIDALSGWWTRATGSGGAGGEIRFWFASDEPCVVHVDEAGPRIVRWTVTECAFLPEWVGTRPTFMLEPEGAGRVRITFVHRGLTPDLDCIDMCTQGWNHFIGSLGRFLEAGAGDPFGSAADVARRSTQSASSSAPG